LQPPVRHKVAPAVEFGFIGRQDVAGRRYAPVLDDLDPHHPAVVSALQSGDALGPLAGELADLPQAGTRSLIRSQASGPAGRPRFLAPVITVGISARSPPVWRRFFLPARFAKTFSLNHSCQLPSPGALSLSGQSADNVSLCFCNLVGRGLSGLPCFFDLLKIAPERDGALEFALHFFVDDLGEPDQRRDRQEREPERQRQRIHISLTARW
jgi:hypothetical protein